MNIALIGYGKMGKEIEKLALAKGYQIGLKVTSKNANFNSQDLKGIDVAIEFSQPEFALTNIQKCLNNNIPIVVGTTGWYHKFEEVTNLCQDNKGALIHATNFSIGVNIFFKINTLLAKYMNQQPSYRPEVEEIHHTQKLDSPSGTGISIAEQILAENKQLSGWENNESEQKHILPLVSKRIDHVPGTHDVVYNSEVDSIKISHVAHNRIGFASGALLAAEWLIDKQGVFTMNDVLKLND